MIAGVVISGASVTSVLPFFSDVSRPTALSSNSRSFAGIVNALAFDIQKRAFDVNAEHARHARRRWLPARPRRLARQLRGRR